MYILYLDDSGTPNPQDPHSCYFVLAGLAVHERQTYFLSKDLDRLQEYYFPGETEPLEFHAREMVTGGKRPWHGLSWAEREVIMMDVWRVIARSDPDKVHLFGAAFHKPSYPHLEPVEEVIKQISSRFDLFLISKESDGDEQRGLLVFDRTAGAKDEQVRRLVRMYRMEGSSFGRVRCLADAPFFADSAGTRLLQLADFCAYAVFRRYERGDTRAFDTIANRFHFRGGVIHGLVHITKDYPDCTCPACLSRRLRSPSGP